MEAAKTGRDFTKYFLNDQPEKLAKNRLVYEIVKEYLQKEKPTYSALKSIFKDEFQKTTGVITKVTDEAENENKTFKKYFDKSEEILTSADGIEFVVSKEWNIDNIQNIIKVAEGLGYKVLEVK